MLKNPKIGQHVWFYEMWSERPVGATIVELDTIPADKAYPKERPFANLKLDEGGSNSMLLSELFSTKEELMEDRQKKEDKRIAEIKKSIKSMADLIKFMYDHTVTPAEEYTDWTARRAVKQIAKEKFGINLD